MGRNFWSTIRGFQRGSWKNKFSVKVSLKNKYKEIILTNTGIKRSVNHTVYSLM